MRPTKNIENLIKNAEMDTNANTDEAVLVDVLKAFEKSKNKKSVLTQPNIWRIIMKSRITQLAAVAVIIIACFTGLFFWKSTGSGIALADVLTRIEQVTGYMYQMRSRMTGQKTNIEWTWTVLVSKENGIKMTGRNVNLKNGKIHHGDTYLLPKLNSVIFVMHEDKSYVPIKYDGTKLDFYREECNDPRIIIKQILSCEHTSLGQSVIDGITVEGFQTTDPTYKGGFMGQADFMGEYKKVDVKLWVGVNTFLPVRLEEDIVTEKGKHIHEVSYDFRWNVVVNADDFEPNIPADYRLPAGDIIIPASNEENAIKGLRLFANLAEEYPVNLDNQILLYEEAKRLTGFDKDSFQDLPDDEKTKKNSELIALGAPAFFYKTLVDENKDPAYYGKTVGPDDTNKVLLRWKLDDGQYRVIFGDLSIKNITGEELAELEKP
jgi:hypothetical protein